MNTAIESQHDAHESAFRAYWIISGNRAFRRGRTADEAADKAGVPHQCATRDNFRQGFVFMAFVRGAKVRR